MQTVWKRAIAALLTAALLCALALGASAETYAGACGDNVSWSLNPETGVLCVTGTGEMQDYAYSSFATSAPWTLYHPLIRSVVIGVGVTGIGACTFCDCENLTAVVIPDGVTRIGDSAFEYCTSLENITLPDSVTHIGASAFASCPLRAAAIGSSVESIGDGAFSDCASLLQITLPESLRTVGAYAFCYCASLAAVTVPDGVTAIGADAFDDVALIYYNGTASGSPWGAIEHKRFVGVDALTFTDDTQRELIACDPAYAGKLVLPNSLVTIRAGAFRDCAYLTEIVVPASVTAVGAEAFRGCTALNSITLPFVGLAADAADTDAVFGAVFGCTASPAPGTVRQFCGESASAYYYIPDSLRSVTLTGCANVPFGAFSSCAMLERVTLGESVAAVGQKAFYGCTGLRRVMFRRDRVTIAQDAFDFCGEYAVCCAENSYWHAYAMRKGLRYCLVDEEAGTEFEIENGVLLAYAGTVPKITLPSSASVVDFEAFRGNNAVTRVALSQTVTQIADYAFAECRSLREIYVPDSVASIGASAFSGAHPVVLCTENSYAHQYAAAHGLNVRFVQILIDLENAVMRVEIPYENEPEVSLVHLTGVSLSVIGFASLPNRTIYRVGETLQTDGLALEAHYTNSMTSILRSGFSVTQPVFSGPGEQTVTVGYCGQTLDFTVTVTHDVVSGDVDGSGTLTLRDTAAILRYLAGGWGVELSEQDADVNKDGSVDLKDAALLRRYIAGGWNVTLN